MAINTTKIIQAIMEGSKIRESKGIIPLFGVYLSLYSVQYYNRHSFAFERKFANGTRAEALLIAAAQECGYATFQGIRNSWEWEQLVAPMIDRKEDQIMGFAAVAMGFGWGGLEIEEIVADRLLRFRVKDSYEADGYRQLHGTADSPKCYMLRGVAGAFMDLVYGGDYPDGCFTFCAEETGCRAQGDAYCEFVAQKSS